MNLRKDHYRGKAGAEASRESGLPSPPSVLSFLLPSFLSPSALRKSGARLTRTKLCPRSAAQRSRSAPRETARERKGRGVAGRGRGGRRRGESELEAREGGRKEGARVSSRRGAGAPSLRLSLLSSPRLPFSLPPSSPPLRRSAAGPVRLRVRDRPFGRLAAAGARKRRVAPAGGFGPARAGRSEPRVSSRAQLPPGAGLQRETPGPGRRARWRRRTTGAPPRADAPPEGRRGRLAGAGFPLGAPSRAVPAFGRSAGRVEEPPRGLGVVSLSPGPGT